jgi:hypothetical protein
MIGIHDKWTVLPHGKLMPLDDDTLFTVVGQLRMPFGTFPRRMTVVRLADSRLVVYSAIALDEPEMRVLEAWGKPSYLIVPSAIHRKDAGSWKARYPEMMVIAPAGARDKAAEVVTVDATDVDFHDPNVRFVAVPGTDAREAALVVSTARGTTLVVNDLIWNVADRRGFGGWLFRMAGFTGRQPKIPRLVVRKAIADKPTFAAQLERWSALAGLKRIIVSHGEIISEDPAEVLRGLARSLNAAAPHRRHGSARVAPAKP